MDETQDGTLSLNDQTGKARALIGLVQGIALYLLYQAFDAKAWPATNAELFAAIVTCVVLVPLVVTSGLTQLRPVRLFAWAAVVTIVCAGLTVYDIGRDAPQEVVRRIPSFQLSFLLLLGLFIAHSLVIAHAGSNRLSVPYVNYYSTSWKIGLQSLMAMLFALAMWLILWFGAQLFELIGISWLRRLIRQTWFEIPVTTLAFNCALHVTDVRDGMIRGLRTLSCNLLAWLLPLMTVIAALFVVALPFTGVQLLWSTKHAASILLGGAAGLVILVNAAYQDGAAFEPVTAGTRSRLFTGAISVAAAVLAVIVPLAAYGIALRVGQYGWTPERVFASACALVAAAYAIGYAFAAVRGPALRPIQITNVLTAGLIVAVSLALISPIADPARISVNDQVARLKSGRTDPVTFDYRFLRFDSNRFGVAALDELAAQKDAPIVAQKSAEMLARKQRYDSRFTSLSAEERIANIKVAFPSEKPLPRALVETDWERDEQKYMIASCLTSRAKCEAVLVDLDGDGADEVVLFNSPSGAASLYRGKTDGKWSYAGTIGGSNCGGVRDALLAGKFETVLPKTKVFVVNGHELPVTTSTINCAALTLSRP